MFRLAEIYKVSLILTSAFIAASLPFSRVQPILKESSKSGHMHTLYTNIGLRPTLVAYMRRTA